MLWVLLSFSCWSKSTRLLKRPMNGVTVETVASSWIEALGGLSQMYMRSVPPCCWASAAVIVWRAMAARIRTLIDKRCSMRILTSAPFLACAVLGERVRGRMPCSFSAAAAWTLPQALGKRDGTILIAGSRRQHAWVNRGGEAAELPAACARVASGLAKDGVRICGSGYLWTSAKSARRQW